MRAKAYPLLEQTIEDGIRFYLLNRVNKYTRRVLFVRQSVVGGPVRELNEWDDIGRHIHLIAEEAADHVMNAISEAFTFTDDEAVVPQEEESQEDEPPVASGGEWVRIQTYDQGRADAEKRIVAFLERELVACAKGVEECVDERDWANAATNADWVARLDYIISRIKADDIGEKE